MIDSTSGNFLNMVDLLARYDPLFKSHLENDKVRTKYMSPKIQNEMIELASKHVLDGIVCEIRETTFFSLILDTTQDISKADQMSVVVRHVSVEESNIAIKQSFLGFIALRSQSSERISEQVCKFLGINKIDLKKCRGQGYNGAAVMWGKYKGVQARIKQISSNAEYVHCALHNLNLVSNDSVNDNTEVVAFYDSINHI